MSIKGRIEKLENRAKQAGNDQTINSNYSAEQVERSKRAFYEAIIKMSNNGQLENCTEKYISEDPLVEKIKKILLITLKK